MTGFYLCVQHKIAILFVRLGPSELYEGLLYERNGLERLAVLSAPNEWSFYYDENRNLHTKPRRLVPPPWLPLDAVPTAAVALFSINC